MRTWFWKVGVVVLLAVLGGLYFLGDYRWLATVKAGYGRTGWVPIATNTSVVFLEKPWTLFKPFPVAAWFFHPDSIVRVNNDIALVKILYVDKETEHTDVYWEAVDCRRMETAIVSEPQKFSYAALASVNWSKPMPKSPGESIFLFVLANFELVPRAELRPN